MFDNVVRLIRFLHLAKNYLFLKMIQSFLQIFRTDGKEKNKGSFFFQLINTHTRVSEKIGRYIWDSLEISIGLGLDLFFELNLLASNGIVLDYVSVIHSNRLKIVNSQAL